MLTLIEGAGLLFWYSFFGVPVGLFGAFEMRKPGEPRVKHPIRFFGIALVWPIAVVLVAVAFTMWCFSHTDKSFRDW